MAYIAITGRSIKFSEISHAAIKAIKSIKTKSTYVEGNEKAYALARVDAESHVVTSLRPLQLFLKIVYHGEILKALEDFH